MKSLIVFSLLFLTIVFGYQSTPSSPTFFWSNYASLGGHSQVGHQDAAKIHERLSKLSQAPELIVLFIENDATSFSQNLNKFSNLKNLIDSSESSLVVQYTSGDAVNSVISGIDKMKTGTIYQVQSKGLSSLKQTRTESLSMEQFLNLVKGNWEAKTNGKTDLVVVSLPEGDLTVHDNYFQQVSRDLNNVNFIGVVASIQPSEIRSLKLESVGLSKFDEQFPQAEEGYGLFPMFMVEAVVIVFILLLILSVGVCCTLSLQSDLRYDLEVKRNRALASN